MTHLLILIIYLAFISLGLPDSVLGAAWPAMYQGFDVPLSYAGIVSMIIAAGTIFSSLMSERVTKRLGTARVTALSVATTALALLGFACSTHYWMLCVFAIPYGLGAGSVDAALNNDVALHYSAKHMSWLHCMWGIGATTGPYLMGYLLTHGAQWQSGYFTLAGIQVVLTAILFLTLPLWKHRPTPLAQTPSNEPAAPVSLASALRLPGAKNIMIAFFAYCAVEQTLMLWLASFFNLQVGFSQEAAATSAALFFVGMTLGRFANGFLALRLKDATLIRMGQTLILLGCGLLFFASSPVLTLIGMALAGLGCAPIYPCIIHSTPILFGADKSQALIGMQMASAYIGTCLMPPLFGLLARYLTLAFLPYYLLALIVLCVLMHELTLKQTARILAR